MKQNETKKDEKGQKRTRYLGVIIVTIIRVTLDIGKDILRRRNTKS